VKREVYSVERPEPGPLYPCLRSDVRLDAWALHDFHLCFLPSEIVSHCKAT
jgi:hypothetical protein